MPGEFIWVRFEAPYLVDLGQGNCGAIQLESGVNLVSYVCFPDQYSSYDLIEELGSDALRAVRRLDPGTGEWLVSTFLAESAIGENFAIPRVSILILDMASEVESWNPGE